MKYTTNIPLARTRLNTIAEEIEAKGLTVQAKEIRKVIENLMIRRPGSRRAPTTRTQVSSEIRTAVISDLKHTELPQEAIARKYNIDGGRVSEIYRSLRN